MRFLRSRRWWSVRSLLVSSSFVVGLVASGLVASGALAAEEILLAQITPDSTLGDENSVLTPGVEVRGEPAELIEGGATRNSNLFHSFSDFNVDAGQRVYFANPSGILDIYSRVTGSTPSSVLGTLGVDGGADLFLINPNGVIFGSDSQLDVAGSFTASTAERLVFSDGSIFSTINSGAAPLLQINVTPGLQYGDNTSASITHQGNLAVGRDLTLGAPLLDVSGELTAGQDIILQGTSRQLSDGNYTVGGYLFTQALNGTGVEMVIPHAQVIVADGDVQLAANYDGSSLHVLAGGQVTQASGVETITVTRGTGGSVTETLSNGDGGNQAVTVSATDQPTVDIRSGVDWRSLTGARLGDSNTSRLAVRFGEATGQGIVIDTVTNHGGAIVLQSAEDITASLLDTSVTVTVASEDGMGEDGGPITLTAGRDISLMPVESSKPALASFSRTASRGGNAVGGNGGAIALTAGRDISNLFSDSFSRARSESVLSGDVVGGNGGAIALSAGRDISDAAADSSSRSESVLSGDVVGGNGGAIALFAGRDISDAAADSSSTSASRARSESVLSGYVMGETGGTIALFAGRDISNAAADSSSSSRARSVSIMAGDVLGGNGGAIDFYAGRDISNAAADSSSSSLSSSIMAGDVLGGGNGGAIDFYAGRDISNAAADSSSTSESDAVPAPASADESDSVSTISGDVLGGGNGGAIDFYAGRDISDATADSSSTSASRARAASIMAGDVLGGGNGGAIDFYAGRDISDATADSSSTSASRARAASTMSGDVVGGNGGAIDLFAGRNISNVDADSSSTSSSDTDASSDSASIMSGYVMGGNGGAIDLFAGRDIADANASSTSVSDTDASSDSASIMSGDVMGGNGGAIDLFAGRNISNVDAESFSISDSRARASSVSTMSGDVVGGSGGAIDLFAGRDISISSLATFSFANESDSNASDELRAGPGGNVTLMAESGRLFSAGADQVNIFTFSLVKNGIADAGGSVSLQATDTLRGLNIVSTSSSAQSGEVTILGTGNLLLEDLDIATSQSVRIDDPRSENPNATIQIPIGGIGQPGDISIVGSQGLTFDNSRVLSTTNSLNPAGIIDITSTGQLVFTNASEIRSDSQSEGAAGNIRLRAPQIRIDQDSALSTSTTAAGAAGNIDINTDTLTLGNGGEILSSTSGSGAGGSVTIQADEAVNLGEGVQNFEPIISVETSGAGTPGEITINTPQFTLSETARLTATATDTAINTEGGGSITLRANAMELSGIVGIFAETQSQTPGGTLILEPYRPNPNQPVTEPDLSVTFEPGAKISASTSSSGPGGNLLVRAPASITLSGPGELTVETTGTGRAGTISFNTQNLSIQDGLTVSASTQGGPGGNITLNGTETIRIDNSTITSEVLTGGENDGGAIEIFTRQLDLTNGTEIRTASDGRGNAGDIKVNAPNVRLFGNSDIVSSVSSGTAGGGNITFNGDTVLAFDDSDIFAFAADGRGGNITFNAAFFGENFVPDSPPPFDGNNRVDVDASGAISGDISIPDISFIENSLSELADTLIDPITLTAGSCIARTTESQGTFITTGTDGLPQHPDSEAPIPQFPAVQVQSLSAAESMLTQEAETLIMEPTGVYQLSNGRIVMSRECTS